jgi:hypothetical protein
MKKILLINNQGFNSDPRPIKFYNFVKSQKKLGYKNLIIPENISKQNQIIFFLREKKNIFLFIKKLFFLKLNFHKNYLFHLIEFLKKKNLSKYDYIYVSDIYNLFAASYIIGKKKIIWDAREYYPKHFLQKFLWNFFYSNFYFKLVIKVKNNILIGFTVSNSIRIKYDELLNKKFYLIYSLPYFKKLFPQKIKSKIKIIHHGICVENRKIENYIELARLLGPNYQITCMLKILDKKYYTNLKKLAANLNNFKFTKTVKVHDIPKKINNYDIGLIILLKKSINHMFAMPNKLFESVQGRLCIVSTPTHDIKKFLYKNKCGVVSKDFDLISIAQTIKSLDKKKIYYFKKNSDKISLNYSVKTNVTKWKKILSSL